MKALLISTCILLAALGGLHAQQDFSKVEINATHVAGSIYMLTGSGGNIDLRAGGDVRG